MVKTFTLFFAKPWLPIAWLGFICIFHPMTGLAQCNCDYIIDPDVVYINGDDPQYQFQPGDEICLQGGTKSELWILNVHGTVDKSIVFRNCEGRLVLKQPNIYSYLLKISDSDYLRITGSGDPAHDYGIEIIGEATPGSGSGVVLDGIYSNIELDHLEIYNNEFAGIWPKEMPLSCELNRDNFTLKNFWIHDNYLHDIGTEAIYLIRENYPYPSASLVCDSTTVFPYGMTGTRIYNNIIERTGWDGMEIHAAYFDTEVYSNRVTDYGLAGDPGQQKGIYLGNGTTGKLYNNVLQNGAGDGIVVAGWGKNTIFNNVIAHTQGIGILAKERQSSNSGTYEILNNTIVNSGFDGMRINSAVTDNFIFNNIIINPSNIEFITLGPNVTALMAGNYLDMNIDNVQFIDPANGNYRLANNSPLINQGVDVSVYGIEFDLDNAGSPAGPSYDIGAYEFQATPGVPIRPFVPGPPSYNAQSPGSVADYGGIFRYGSNAGFYPGWTDRQLADITAGNPTIGQDGLGCRTFRPSLPEHLVEQFGYKVRINTFKHYKSLGMDDHTLFIGFPADAGGHRDPASYCDAGGQSWLFENMYESIWDNGEGGTPVNENNYYAHYVWKLVYLYRDYVKFWQIINEPDFDGGGSGWFPPASEDSAFADVNWWDNDPDPCVLGNMRAPVQHYIRMLRISYEIIKSLAPDDYVVLGGIAYESFLDAILRNTDNPGSFNVEGIGEAGSVDPTYYPNTGGAYFDVATFHLYPQFSGAVRYFATTEFVYKRHSDAAVDAIAQMHSGLQKVLYDRGYDGMTYPKKHFSITEINIPRKPFPYTDPGSAGQDYIGGDEVQRNFVIKAFVQAQISGLLQMYLYNLADDATLEEASNGFELMGLYKKMGFPYSQQINSSGIAFRSIATTLFGYGYDSTRTTAMNLPADVRGAAFVNDSGAYRYVLWAETQADQSEYAAATYSFPSEFGYGEYGVIARPWDHGVNPNAQLIPETNIALGGAPQFFEKSNVASLPIELLSFEAKVKGTQVKLSWSTAWEQSNDYFTLERATDGRTFLDLAEVASQGDSEFVQKYEAYDRYPVIGRNYYRLKQTDIDGTYSYSPLVEVKFEGFNRGEISLYPNPVPQGESPTLSVKLNKDQQLQIRIINLMGQELSTQSAMFPEGKHELPLNVVGLASGLYQLIVSAWRGKVLMSEQFWVR